jgi:hypothetical protein
VSVLSKLFLALCLMALCVLIHTGGVTFALRWVRRQPYAAQRPGRWMWLFVCVAAWTILLHLGAIAVWAFFYFLANVIADLQSAFYFSAVTYTTTGYGDIVLPVEWRLVGGVEALTGILMCGWSTGFFFAIVSRTYFAQGAQTTAS